MVLSGGGVVMVTATLLRVSEGVPRWYHQMKRFPTGGKQLSVEKKVIGWENAPPPTHPDRFLNVGGGLP